MDNPYESPREQSSVHSSKPYLESKTNLAKLSWRIPLFGLLTSIVINAVAKPIGIVGGVIFMGSVVIGFVLSLIGIASSFKYSRVAVPAIVGLILNSFLALAIVGMFHAASVARDAASKALERQGIKSRTDRQASSMPERREP